MKLKTNIILALSLLIIISTVIVAAFAPYLHIGKNESPYFVLILLINFGLNVAGMVIATYERKTFKRKAFIGLLGNSVLAIAFIGFSILVIKQIT